jgi:membrane protease YdiL (CAAX protease family)
MQAARTHLAPSPARLWLGFGSPLAVLLVGNLAARLSQAWLGEWAWVGTGLAYWAGLAGLAVFASTPEQRRRWSAPSRGSRAWLALAVLIGLLPFPMLFFPNLNLLGSPVLVICWLAVAVVNGPLEEIYWRGLLLDALDGRLRWAGLLYTTVLFTAIHPLMWGTFSHPMNFPPFWGIVAVMSVAFTAIYLKTRSLRWPILSHVLADLGNLSVFVFMNLIPFPGA